MVSKSDTSERIREKVERSLENDRVSEWDRATSRECTSDRFSGVQLNIYGNWVSARSVIDTIAEIEGAAIESMYHATDAEEPHLGVFVAYIPTQEHPAFV